MKWPSGLKRTYTDPEGVTYSYAYNDNNQLTEVHIPGQGSIALTSYNWTRPEAVTLPGGSTREFAYDSLMRVERITSTDPGQNIVADYRYAYDRMDNILTRATEHGEYAYGYDELYRLVNADNPILDDEAFTYDPVGNRITSAATTMEWTYNQNNELQAYNAVSFQYDATGNTIKKTEGSEITHYIYNEEYRLIRVENGSNRIIAEYYYDPFGRRLWKEVDGKRICFLYSDEGLVAEMDASGNITKSYGWQPGSTWTTDPLFMKEGADYYFYHNDHLGTPQKMTSADGSVVWSARYESFGKAEVEVETVVNNLRFPGQYHDQETGLHYNYWRYYDPGTGRYLRTDPSHSMQPKGGSITYLVPFLFDTPQEFNLHLYVQNNPVNEFDSRGLIGPFGPGLENIRRNPCEIETDPYQECLEEAGKARSLCTRLLWVAQAKSTAICAFACVGSTVGYPACLASCSLAFHRGYSIARAGCWAAYLGMVENCRRMHGK